MYWNFFVKTVDLRDSYTVRGNTSMNIIIAPVPVLNMSELYSTETTPAFASSPGVLGPWR